MGRVIKAADMRKKPERISDRRDRELRIINAESERDLENAEKLHERSVELACAMAERFVGESLKLDPGLITRIYERTVEELGGATPVIIRLHPSDKLNSQIEEIAQRRGWEIQNDPSVNPGDCVVKSQGITVQRKLKQAIDFFREACK